MNYVRHLALVFAVLAAAACSSNSVQVDVLVYTSLVPGPQFATIENELLEPTAPTEPARLLDTVRGNATFGDDFVHGRRVASFASLSPGDYVVNVRLVRPDGTLLVGRRVRFQASADRVIPVVLTPDCVGVTCPSPTGSPALSACFGGQCVDERCHPPDPEFCPTLTLCNTAADCPTPSAACATAECVAGLCTNTAAPSACAANEWCDPDHGCLPREVLSDGGLDDAANLDAAMNLDAGVDADANADASSDRCGLPCELDGDPCHIGALRCDETGQACVPFATRPAGTPCGADQVCDRYGACGTCTAGARCTVRCLVGTTRCDAGIETCDVGAGDVTVAPGDACSLDSVCHDGDACGSGTTCSADHVCELCTNDGEACSLESG